MPQEKVLLVQALIYEMKMKIEALASRLLGVLRKTEKKRVRRGGRGSGREDRHPRLPCTPTVSLLRGHHPCTGIPE